MRALALSGIVVGVLLIASQVARASCGIPGWVGTADGAHVPTRGVVYIHDEAMGWDVQPVGDFLKVEWVGVSGATISVRRVEASVASIEYEGPAGARLRVFNRYDTQLAEYVLDDTWHAPLMEPRVLQFWHYLDEWTCSWGHSLLIQIDQPTAAVRVQWTTNGHSVDYIEAVQTEGDKRVLELGKINCGDQNMPLEQLLEGGDIELFAIRNDGSEVPIAGMPRHVALSKLPPTGSHMDHAFTIVATQSAPQTVRTMLQARNEAGAGLGVLVLVLAALGVVGALWLIRRVETPASDCSPAS